MMKYVIILFSFLMLTLAVPSPVEVEADSGLVVVIGEVVDSVGENQIYVFIEDIADFESDGQHTVVNKFGMMGKYQFSPTTVLYLGYDVTEDEFLSNPELQDEVMIAYLKKNYKSLKPYIERFVNTEVKGVMITESAILAGAHFAGARGMIRFLTTDSTTTDSNGTELSEYMNLFADYEINLEEL
jgi:hypothetical protein